MILDTVDEKKKGVHTRYLILLIIFIVTAVNYADRATLSIAGTEVAKELQLSAVSMGYIFSAFGWAYLLMQIPGGWLLDKFGSKKVYTYSLFFWSLFTFLQGFVDMFPLAWAGISMFFMRFMLGFSEAPSFPANARIVAAWFPTKERGTASAIFNSAQYFSLALFSPLLGWLTFAWGWEHVFTVMGVIGFVLTALWIKLIHNPTDHPRMSAEELKFISENGAVVDMDHKKPGSAAASGPKLHYIKQLLSNRMMLGVFFGQYFINTITWFFLTWFPIYLVQEKGMSILKVGLVASIPALCGFAGGVLGGVFSDYLIKRGLSLTLARKLPIVLGMLLASTIILCNYTNNTTLVVMLMALAAKQVQIGCWSALSNPISTEVLGLAGFDWLVLDGEHAPNDISTFIPQLMALKGSASAPVVRVPTNEPVIIKRLLDIGFYNFLIPFVETKEEAELAVASTRYPPEGIRGVSVSHRANMFGTVADYFAQSNKNITILVQIESQQGVDNVDAIAATEGVDGIFVGPSDLAAALGHLGNASHPDVQKAIQHIFNRASAHGKPSGILAPVEADARRYLEWGATFVAVGSDLGVFRSATQKLADTFKK